MTSIHNASLAAGASSAELTVGALEPHGVNAETDCQLFCKNATTGVLTEVARLTGGTSAVVYPTTNILVVKNTGSAAGTVQVTAK